MTEDEILETERRLPSPAERDHLQALAEAAIFASPQPVALASLARALGQAPAYLQALLQEVAADFERVPHGLRLRTVGGGYQFTTKPEHHADLKELFTNLPTPAPLSRAAIETAVAIALKQPVTAAEVQAVRGVRNSDPLRTLLKRKLIAPAGRAKTRGHPLRYRTTQRFLVEFGLESLDELRSAKELTHQPQRCLD